jgi:hypothetical protein
VIPPPPTLWGWMARALWTIPVCMRHICKEGYIVRKLQRALDAMVAWCERWNIKIKEDKTRAIYLSHQRAAPGSLLTMNGRNMPFVNNVKYLGVLFDNRITWRLHIERIKAKAFRTFIRLYPLFKSERLNSNIKLTILKSPIRSVKTSPCTAWEFSAELHLLQLQLLQNRVLRTIGNFPRRTSVRYLHLAFQISYV